MDNRGGDILLERGEDCAEGGGDNMNKKEWNKQAECMHCQYFGRCEVHWGIKCTRRGGKRVPRFRSLDEWLQEA